HEGYGNRTGRNRLPARLLLTGSIPARVQTLDRRSTRAISPADETAKAGLKRVPSRASIRTRGGCSYNQYPAVGFNARKGIWRTCRSTAPVRTATEPRLRASRPFAPDTGAPTISIRRWGSMPGMGSGFTCRSTAPVRTGIEPNLRASPIRTRHGCSYNQYPALGIDARKRDLVLPVGAPATVRTAIEPNLRVSPIRTRHGCSYNQYPALRFNTPERDLAYL